MNDAREKALLSCPFCNGAAAVESYERYEDTLWRVMCGGHCCARIDCEDTKDNAIAAWNRREALASPAQGQNGVVIGQGHPRSEEHCFVTIETNQRMEFVPMQKVCIDTAAPSQPVGDGVPCPTCGAPCATTVHPRGGDWGWGTTDKARTTYKFATPQPSAAKGEAVFVSGAIKTMNATFVHMLSETATQLPDGTPAELAEVSDKEAEDFLADICNGLGIGRAWIAQVEPVVKSALARRSALAGIKPDWAEVRGLLEKWREPHNEVLYGTKAVRNHYADELEEALSRDGAKERICVWTPVQPSDIGVGYWNSACGHDLFRPGEGNYCPGCGGRIETGGKGEG